MVAGTALWVLISIAAVISIAGIVAVLSVGAERFAQAGYRRRNWILLIVLIGPLAVLFYFATVRHHVLHPERYRSVDGVAPADR